MPAALLCCPLQVFPKPYDLFNLALYGSMILLALFARDWLLLEVGLLTNAANACFMWVSTATGLRSQQLGTTRIAHLVQQRSGPGIWSTHTRVMPFTTRQFLLLRLSQQGPG